MKLLLVNPPARQTVLRDYLCSKTTKADYLYHPVDLLFLSGTLAQEHEVRVLDCVAEHRSREDALKTIQQHAPEVVIGLVASVTWSQDRAFFAQVAQTGVRVLATGDVLHESADQRLQEEPWLEAALHDFTSSDVLRYLDGSSQEEFPTLTVRRGTNIQRATQTDPHKQRGEYRIPRPRHELFGRKGYRFPFARRTPFATVLTDYGCPYPCTFCVMSTLGFRVRPVEDVLIELDYLRANGTREVFFLDQTFGAQKERGLELARQLEQRGDLTWTAFLRPDRAHDELLHAMVRAGCHTVILGAESASDAILDHYRKGYGTDCVRDAFQRARAAGLRTVGTFLIGLPEDDASSLEEQLRYALELELDYLSVNVAVPRFGTPFRKEVLELGLIAEQDLEMDQAGDGGTLPTTTLDRDEMLRLKRRLIRRFYLRPSYLARRLSRITSPRELLTQAKSGLALFARNGIR